MATPTFTVYQTPDFTKWVRKNRLTGAVNKLKADLHANPDLGDVIPGGGGLRKVRMAGLGRGKQGGFRVIYFLLLGRSAAVLMDGYSKSEKDDLTADELKALAAARRLLEAAVAEANGKPEEQA